MREPRQKGLINIYLLAVLALALVLGAVVYKDSAFLKQGRNFVFREKQEEKQQQKENADKMESEEVRSFPQSPLIIQEEELAGEEEAPMQKKEPPSQNQEKALAPPAAKQEKAPSPEPILEEPALPETIEGAKPIAEPQIKPGDLYGKVLLASVSIYCKFDDKNEGMLGSGMIITADGHILTAAHVVSFWEEGKECLVRKADPYSGGVYNFAYAKIIFIPSVWQGAEDKNINKRDFAILKINRPVDEYTPLPEEFVYIPVNYDYAPEIGEKIYSASFPAEGTSSISALDLVFGENISITNKYYVENKGILEAVQVGDNIGSKQGASGGAIMNRAGEVIGVVVSKSDPIYDEETNYLITETEIANLTSYLKKILEEEFGGVL